MKAAAEKINEAMKLAKVRNLELAFGPLCGSTHILQDVTSVSLGMSDVITVIRYACLDKIICLGLIVCPRGM